LEEVAVCAGHKVLTEDGNIVPIVGDPQGILDGQLKPRTINLLNIIINLIILMNYI
jgi:hypothetical protein